MPPHQLAVQMVQHVGNGEMAIVGGHLRVKEHLQHQVAQFLGQMRPVAALDGVEDLVGLFQRVFADGIEGLLAVPGAAVGSAQPRHDLDRLGKQLSSSLRIGSQRIEGFGEEFWLGVHAVSVYRAGQTRVARAGRRNARARTPARQPVWRPALLSWKYNLIQSHQFV